MKRLALFILAAFILVGCGSSSEDQSKDYDKVKHITGALLFYETTLEGLEERAYTIVKGRLGDDAMNVYDTRDGFPMYTSVSLEISDVYKGELKREETIKIIEPYCVENRILWSFGNYLTSKPNQEYIFFLGDQSTELAPGVHFVIHQERGRYLVPNDDQLSAESYSREELSLGELDDELYISLYQDVIDAYMK